MTKPVADELGGAAEVLGVSVRLEAEAAQLPEADRAELLEGLGLGEGALPRLARAAYRLLGRRTFFTTGDKESRAWTFRAGAKAPECAGVIHSDLQRGFIRAEVVHWDELVALGSWAAAREVGKLRVEGKEYEVTDGDVLDPFQCLNRPSWAAPRGRAGRDGARRDGARRDGARTDGARRQKGGREQTGRSWAASSQGGSWWWRHRSATWGTSPARVAALAGAGYVYCEDTRRHPRPAQPLRDRRPAPRLAPCPQ